MKEQIQQNKIFSLLCSLGLCDELSIETYYPRVRDRDDVSVLRCRKCGVIFLSRTDHIDISDYEGRDNFEYWEAQDRKNAIIAELEDSQRRAKQFQYILKNKKWLDVGTGAGGILDILAPITSETIAVEPQKGARNDLISREYEVYPNVEDVPHSDIDIVTLFHVFEHMIEPVDILESISTKMRGGRILIEVPHANDFLLSFLDLDSFKKFTFWSEHLILHTRQTLTLFLEKAGFKNICIEGYQRYPLANHLCWLSQGKPGGHHLWSYLRSSELDSAYAQMLAHLDKTDTLIAVAEKL